LKFLTTYYVIYYNMRTKIIFALLLAVSLLIAGCTPTANINGNLNANANVNANLNANVNLNSNINSNVNGNNATSSAEVEVDSEIDVNLDGNNATKNDQGGKSDDQTKDGKELGQISFNLYTNPAIQYSIQIPANWYWRHFFRTEISANAQADDYLMISPTYDIGDFSGEDQAEIIVAVSSNNLLDTVDETLSKTNATVAGQIGSRLTGIINGKQKIEYQFVKNGKTYRLIYLANSGMTNNEAVFEAMVKSFTFVEVEG